MSVEIKVHVIKLAFNFISIDIAFVLMHKIKIVKTKSTISTWWSLLEKHSFMKAGTLHM